MVQLIIMNCDKYILVLFRIIKLKSYIYYTILVFDSEKL